jgi:hypothetical protein
VFSGCVVAKMGNDVVMDMISLISRLQTAIA